MTPSTRRAVREALLAWYEREKRDLPWRERAGDPYAVWVSEIMLQQTRVDTVIPYFERFLARFPTPRALADASEDEVLSAWSGLGYYRRARMLHRGVKEVVTRYGGDVPESPEARLALPGVGRYTAGAIGSVAFGREEPIVDGNVARVLSRVDGIETPLPAAATQRALWGLAGELVIGDRPGDLNQAMMELGALVCTPRSPSCDTCPIAESCVARREGRVESLPRIPKKKKPRRERWVAVVATVKRQVAMVRGEAALYGGLHAPPMVALASGESEPDAARRALAEAGVQARLEDAPRGEVSHILTHKRLTVVVFRATRARVAKRATSTRLVGYAAADRPDVGVARLTEKLLERARSE